MFVGVEFYLPFNYLGLSLIILLFTEVISDETCCCIGLLDDVDFAIGFIYALYYSVMPDRCSFDADVVSMLKIVRRGRTLHWYFMHSTTFVCVSVFFVTEKCFFCSL